MKTSRETVTEVVPQYQMLTTSNTTAPFMRIAQTAKRYPRLLCSGTLEVGDESFPERVNMN